MRARGSGRTMGIGARRGPRHAARRVAVAVACLAVLAACADSGAAPEAGPEGSGSPSGSPDGAPSRGSTVPAVDTEHAVDRPGRLTDSTLPADMLIFSQQALSDEVVEAIKALDGVAAVERLGMGTA